MNIKVFNFSVSKFTIYFLFILIIIISGIRLNKWIYLNDFNKMKGFSEMYLEEKETIFYNEFDNLIYLKSTKDMIQVFSPKTEKNYKYTFIGNGIWYMEDAEYIKTIDDSLIIEHYVLPKSWIVKYEYYTGPIIDNGKVPLTFENDSMYFVCLLHKKEILNLSDDLKLNMILEFSNKLNCFIKKDCQLDTYIEISNRYKKVLFENFKLYYVPKEDLEYWEGNRYKEKYKIDSLKIGRLAFGEKLISGFDIEVEEITSYELIRQFPELEYK